MSLRTSKPALENLGDRIVPATLSFNAATGTMAVVGTDNAERILVQPVGTSVRVTVTDLTTNQVQTLTRHSSLVKKIDIDAAGGNDEVRNYTSVSSIIKGGRGNDLIYGGNGSDSIEGGLGNDTMFGLGGDDVLVASGQNLTLGVATLSGSSVGHDIFAGFERAWLTGTNSADVIDASTFAGNATIRGLSGDDVLKGGFGDDTIYGGDGNDKITGNAGADYLNGQAGNDDLWGNDGNDHMYGEDGNDSFNGGAGDDFMNGGAGSDDFISGSGSDVMFGGTGADFFWDINVFKDKVTD